MIKITNAPRSTGTNIISGLDENGWYTVRAERKGQTYKVLPVRPMSAADIEMLREEKNMSQKELADALGVTTARVRSWERGDTTPNDMTSRLIDMIGRGVLFENKDEQNDTDRRTIYPSQK